MYRRLRGRMHRSGLRLELTCWPIEPPTVTYSGAESSPLFHVYHSNLTTPEMAGKGRSADSTVGPPFGSACQRYSTMVHTIGVRPITVVSWIVFCDMANTHLMVNSVDTYLLDTVQLSNVDVNIFKTVLNLPWSFRTSFGVLVDSVGIDGLYRSPYVGYGAVVACISLVLWAVLPPPPTGEMGVFPYIALFQTAGMALFTVAGNAFTSQTMVAHTAVAVEIVTFATMLMPALAGLLFSIAYGPLKEAISPTGIFAVFAGLAFVLFVFAAMGFMGEKKRHSLEPGTCGETPRNCVTLCSEPAKRALTCSAILIAVGSTATSLVSLYMTKLAPITTNVLAAFAGMCMTGVVYWMLARDLNVVTANLALWQYLCNFCRPKTSIMFDWFHSEISGEDCASQAICESVYQCTFGTIPTGNTTNTTTPGTALPICPVNGCGWRTRQQLPCISDQEYNNALVVAQAALFVISILFSLCMHIWSYRWSMFTFVFFGALIVALDTAWVYGWTGDAGIVNSLIVYGDTVFSAIVTFLLDYFGLRLWVGQNSPRNLEAMMFANMKGLEHVGLDSGTRIMTLLLGVLNVERPSYNNLGLLNVIKLVMYTLPCIFVWCLFPAGGPRDGRVVAVKRFEEEEMMYERTASEVVARSARATSQRPARATSERANLLSPVREQ